jgi:hypothetical protein
MLHCDVLHSEQMRDGVAEGSRFGLVKAAHDPLELQNDPSSCSSIRGMVSGRCGCEYAR